MTTLAECIEEAKVCLSICQPSSLISRMSTLTVALLRLKLQFDTFPFTCKTKPVKYKLSKRTR